MRNEKYINNFLAVKYQPKYVNQLVCQFNNKNWQKQLAYWNQVKVYLFCNLKMIVYQNYYEG